MERRHFIKSLTAAGAGILAGGNLFAEGIEKVASRIAMADNGRKPNVIIIMADDLGYGDVSCYGAARLRTENIDRLAKSGLRFTNGYAAAATSTPSRYSLLTGFYPWRKKGAQVLKGDAPLLIDTSMDTLPKVFQRAGYATGVIGKWHIGMGNGNIDWNKKISPGPNDTGFDYSFVMAATNDRVPTVYCENGFVAGLKENDPLLVNYNKNYEGEPTGKENPELLKLHPSHGHDMSIWNGISRIGFQRGGKDAMWRDEEMGDRFSEKAKEFIASNKNTPFFLYYALHQPHVPRTPNKRFEGLSGMGPRGDSILEADWCVGQILDYIEELKIAEDTIVVFTSDNGPVLDDGYKDNAVELSRGHKPAGIMRGGKYSLYEGGTRVPFIVSWKGKINPGVSSAMVCQVDLMASFSELLNVYSEKRDGEQLTGALLGKSSSGRENVVLEASGGKVIYRKGDWILIPPYNGPAVAEYVNIELGNSPEYQLYNIKSDPSQTENLYYRHKEVAEGMAEELDKIKRKF